MRKLNYVKLFENFTDLESINEDFLELKSIVKQLYSLLKEKGYDVEIRESSEKSRYRGGDRLVGTKDSQYLGDKGGTVEIHQFSDVEEIGVFLPARSVAYQFIISPENKEIIKKSLYKPELYEIYQKDNFKDWDYLYRDAFVRTSKETDDSDIIKNPQILEFLGKLGINLIDTIKSKYPNIQIITEIKGGNFCLYFRETKTRKNLP